VIDQGRDTSEEAASAWSYSTGGAPPPRYQSSDAKTEFSINPVGYYQGVSTTGEALPPFAPQTLGDAAVLTWTGFEMHEGGSRVFVQLSASVVHDAEVEANRVRITLPSTSVNVRNNKRYLDTRYFDTPVRRVSVRRSGSDTVVTIDLREDVRAPNVGMRAGANGYQMLVVEFEPYDTGEDDGQGTDEGAAAPPPTVAAPA
jgi:hypothetical protein